MAPVISALALLGWMGTITPKDAKKKIVSVYNTAKEAAIGHWRGLFGEPIGKKLIAKQAPPGGGGPNVSFGNTQMYVNPNPSAIYNTGSGPYLNDLLNGPTYKTASLQSGTFSAPPPAGPNPNHVNAAGIPHPNFSRGRRSGPNAMTRLSNGSIVAPNLPVAKKAAPKM
jgi:hypothetical protein